MSRALSTQAELLAKESGTGAPIEQCMLVQQEIWRIVSEAARRGARIGLKQEAERIAREFPAEGFTVASVADAIVYAAVDCGVTFETRPKSRPTVEIPHILSLVSKRRKPRAEKPSKARPTFAGVPIPAPA
jgi:hypothetical protein